MITKEYNGVNYVFHTETQCLEIIINSSEFKDDEESIRSLSAIVELASLSKPKFVLLNKENTNFELTAYLYQYVKDIIYKQLQQDGVRHIIFLLNKKNNNDVYKKYLNWNNFMVAETSRYEIFDKMTSIVNN